MKKCIVKAIILCAALSVASPLLAQTESEIIVIEPLFEYPVAPEELGDLTSRSDYIVTHFWDNMDFNLKVADQNALNDAFGVYASAMRYADSNTVFSSIDSLLKRLKENPTLTLQMAKAAEELLYSRRAPMWSDEAYLPFLRAVDKSKGISDTRKMRFRDQLRKLTATQRGVKAPTFRYRSADTGRYTDFKPESEYTLIIFGDPECDDCRFAKMKLGMAADLADMVEDKRAEVLFIVPDVTPGEEEAVLSEIKGDLPNGWQSGVGFGIVDIYDLRSVPSIYLLGKRGALISKNVDASTTLSILRDKLEGAKADKKGEKKGDKKGSNKEGNKKR